MMMMMRSTNLQYLYALFTFSFLCLCFHGFIFYSANTTSDYSEKTNFLQPPNCFFKNIEKSSNLEIGGGGSVGPRRLLLGGPGSSPPRCAWKCGGCMPCKPVHVPVPPGARVTTEYYPEAWRCKCGNKLYMP